MGQLPERNDWREAMIAEEMEEWGIGPDDVIGKRQRFHIVHGNGLFSCSKCHSNWKSYWTWVKFDMKRQKIVYIWQQKCKNCIEAPITPRVYKESLSDMLQIVLGRIRGVPPSKRDKPSEPRNKQKKKPHQCNCCEKCGYKDGDPCWYPRKTLKASSGCNNNA